MQNSVIKTLILCLTLFTPALAQSLELVSQPKGGILMDLLNVDDVLVAAQWNTGAVLSSQDGGKNFRSTKVSEGRKAESLAVFNGKLYVSIQDAGVFVSEDKGSTFKGPVFYEKHRKYYDLAVAGDKLFVSTGHGLFQFDGSSWSPNPKLTALQKTRYNTHVNAGSGDKLAVGIGSELLLSLDSGATWKQIESPARDQINCLEFDGSKLYVGSYNDGVWTVDTTNSATAVTAMQDEFKRQLANVRSLAVDGNVIVAGCQARGCWVSKDGGSTWAEAKDGKRSARSVRSLLHWNGQVFAGVGTQLYRVRF
jgi:photosystem II stability/assembly factor-like uncharacterized protein